MARTHFVPIFIILILLCANNLANAESKENSDTNGLYPRKIDVDRQGNIGSSLLGGPLAIAAFLFSLPLLPALLIAPLAIAGISPAIGAVGNFMSSISGNGGSSGFGSLASLLSPPNAGGAEAGSSTAESSMSSVVSSPGGFGSNSPFASALRSISELLFSRRFSQNNPQKASQSTKPTKTSQSDSSEAKPDNLGESQQNRFGTLMTSLKEVYGILKSGLRRYEITDSDCQSRIICEVHQKAVGRSTSLGSFTTTLLDLIGVESHLDRSNAFSERAKSVIKDFVRAAKTGLSNNDCALVFSRCPSSSPIEPPFNQISGDYFKLKPHVFEVNQLLQTKVASLKPNRQRPAIKSSIVTTPRTVNYYSNINKL